MRHHKALGIIFLIAIASAAVAGLYYWQTIKQIPNPYMPIVHKELASLSGQSNVPSDWKTYTNEKYEFEFKYPKDWIGDIPNNWSDSGQQKTDFVINLTQQDDDEGSAGITFLILSGEAPAMSESLNLIKESTSNSNGITWTETIYAEKAVPSVQYITATTHKNNQEIDFTSVYYKSYEGIFNQILSTFKFTGTIKKQTGVLKGHVTIGPFCPVEQPGRPCPVPKSAYDSVLIFVYDPTTKLSQTQKVDGSGNYSFVLAPGSYSVSYQSDYGFKNGRSEIPFEIKAAQTTVQNFNIDTGIR